MKIIFRILLFVYLLAAFSCANQVSPSGGDKDVKPPKPLKYIPENYSTNFKTHDIAIVFNEYVQLKDVSTQLIISPPLKYPVQTKIRKKTLFIHFEDTLQQNTTYTLNFGNAVADIHEGNVLENFQYVFSTGDVIDSLVISGKIENAFDKKTEKGIYAMLYRSKEDSLPLKKIPDYFAKTNDSGVFHIRNVSPGDYKLVALKDNNSNYLFDNNDELIAFSDSPAVAPASGIILKLFKELPKQQLLKSYSEEAGKALIIYSRPLKSEKISFLSDTSLLKIFSLSFTPKKDTLTIWYRNQLSDSLSLVIKHVASELKGEMSDTVTIRLRRSDTKGRFKYVPALTTQYESRSETQLALGRPLELILNHPVEQYDLSNISATEDSLPVKLKFHFIDSLKRVMVANYNWKEKAKYTVLIPKGTFTDIFQIKNDSIELLFKTKSATDYGTMSLKIQPLQRGGQSIVQLIDDKETVYRQSTIQSDTILHYEYLDPRIYRLKVIEDSNSNGEWDTGNYLQHLQPEHVFYYKENITVRANWDVDVKWKVE